MEGILRCSRYAFGPNRLHYCGPDKNSEIKAYINEGAKDAGLENLISKFQTLYPYLSYIARTNNIRDPFDSRVVEAYWLGNGLLEKIDQKSFYRHLLEDHKIKDKMGRKSFSFVEDKIEKGAVPHHSFHVFNVWKRTGHDDREHTLESMDECRVSWGKVTEIDGPFITVLTEPLLYANKKLFIGTPIKRKLVRRLESEYDIEQIVVGNIVSIHWGVICEVITQKQMANLKKYTLRNLALANQTL